MITIQEKNELKQMVVNSLNNRLNEAFAYEDKEYYHITDNLVKYVDGSIYCINQWVTLQREPLELYSADKEVESFKQVYDTVLKPILREMKDSTNQFYIYKMLTFDK